MVQFASPLGAAPEPSSPPDLILYNATVVRVDPPGATARSVAVREDRIVFVGSDDRALALRGPRTRVVDLKGATIIPGLIDAHGHISSLGSALGQVDAVGTRSAEEIASRVREAARTAQPDEWILGRGWDQNDWANQDFPTKHVLDEAAPRNPVALSRIDGHALWVSSSALSAAGITAQTRDPDGGAIHRDAQGAPTGILVDNAMGLLRSKIPEPTRARTKEALLRAMNRCLDSGLTGVHDAGISDEEAGIYEELAAEGSLPIRVYAMLGGNSRSIGRALERPPLTTQASRSAVSGGFLAIRAIKLGIDGALGSRGAAMLEDYSDSPGNRGLLTRTPSEIERIAKEAVRKGYQVCIHAIGDRGNRLALDALESALKSAPPGDHRFRIEHAQVLALSDIRRFKAAGIIPSMQPTHCTSDMPWAETRVGPERIKGAYAWRQILESGVRIPGGSDFPVESENPFLGLYAAVTRQDVSGWPAGGWRSEERMTREEALRSFTMDAAYAGFAEADLGSVSEGKKADLLILERNPLTADVSDIPKMRPLAILVNGRVARSSPAFGNELPVATGRP